jgi:hypothetical protein
MVLPMVDRHSMTVGGVVRASGLSAARIVQLDEVLHPVRRNRWRYYDPAVVDAWLTERAKRDNK